MVFGASMLVGVDSHTIIATSVQPIKIRTPWSSLNLRYRLSYLETTNVNVFCVSVVVFGAHVRVFKCFLLARPC